MGLLLSGPKSCFQAKENIAFLSEVKVTQSEGTRRGTQSNLTEVQCEVSTLSDNLRSKYKHVNSGKVEKKEKSQTSVKCTHDDVCGLQWASDVFLKIF